MRAPLIRAGAALLAAPAFAFELVLPIDCTLGRDCMIQQYVDRDPSVEWTDHACGTLSYDGHKGTDFRLRTLAEREAGVNVLAAAPGTVEALRDGMEDIASDAPGAPDLAGRDCGNGVLIRHEGGWTTQYCHMRKGSLAVSQGDRVAAGQPIGQVGLSGSTHFPHVHLTVRNPAGEVVDPFDSRPMSEPCGTAGTPLWAVAVPYVPGGLISAGMLDRVPEYDEVKATGPPTERLPADAPAVVAWAFFYGLRTGDEIAQTLTAPSGEVIASSLHVMDRNRAQQYRAVGRRRPAEGWPPGTYIARSVLNRAGKALAEAETRLEIAAE